MPAGNGIGRGGLNRVSGLNAVSLDQTFNVSVAGKKMSEVVAEMRKNIYVAPAEVTINVADGTYEDVDDSLGNNAWCDLTGIIFNAGTKLNITGNTTTPASVAIRGDTSGDTVPVRKIAFIIDIEGGGDLKIEGFESQYFDDAGISQSSSAYLGRVDVLDLNCKNIGGNGVVLRGVANDFVCQRNDFSNNTTGITISGMNNITFDSLTCDNNSGKGMSISRCLNVLITGFLSDCSISNNGSTGIDILDCGEVSFQVVSIGSNTFNIDDNGGNGINADGVIRMRILETPFGGTPEVIMNRNNDSAVYLRGVGILLLDVSSVNNVSHATQVNGIKIDNGSSVSKTANTIKGNPTPANDEVIVVGSNGHIS